MANENESDLPKKENSFSIRQPENTIPQGGLDEKENAAPDETGVSNPTDSTQSAESEVDPKEKTPDDASTEPVEPIGNAQPLDPNEAVRDWDDLNPDSTEADDEDEDYNCESEYDCDSEYECESEWDMEEATYPEDVASTASALSSSDGGGSGDDEPPVAVDDSLPPSKGEGRMRFLEHLLELRKRLAHAVIGIIVAIILAIIFFPNLYHFLMAPVKVVNLKFMTDPYYINLVKENGWPVDTGIINPIHTKMLGMMGVYMKASIYAGLVLSSPWVALELWLFVAPGLKATERRVIRPIMAFGVFFFIGGAAFCYYLVFPITLEFMVWLDVSFGVRPWYQPSDMMGVMLTFMLIFGMAFEIPLVSAIFAKLGLLKPKWVTKYWRAICTGCFVFGALLSPGGEPISMMMMSGAMVVLYGMSIVLVRIFYPKKTSNELVS